MIMPSWKRDIIGGFLVFLVALPLCLGIAIASGFPPVAGIFSAIIGGILTPWISNSELTIKGPAAGLIVIVLGCMNDFGFTFGRDPTADFHAYQLALGVGVAAAVVQILLGILQLGILGEFFPPSCVHGMLTAIGIILVSKQLPIAMGVDDHGHINPEIAFIGLISFLIICASHFFENRYLKRIPGPMLILLVAVPLGVIFDLSHEHTYSLMGRTYRLGQNDLVSVPAQLFGSITLPDFSGLMTMIAWKWILMYAMVGSLESMLSAKAIDALDPWKRKTNLDNDLMAIGVANLVSSFVGGLPMISEIVRSSANIDNGAKTRYANFFHGICLLLAILLIPQMIHDIPVAALAAMLVYTGSRLAHPKEFVRIFRIGPEQLIIYLGTIITVLATDLLVGIFAGVVLKILIHLYHGLPFRALFYVPIRTELDGSGEHCQIVPERAVVFTHWLSLKRLLNHHGISAKRHITIDMSNSSFIDHTVMEKIHEMQTEFKRCQIELSVKGLDSFVGLSAHPLAARRRPSNEK